MSRKARKGYNAWDEAIENYDQDLWDEVIDDYWGEAIDDYDQDHGLDNLSISCNKKQQGTAKTKIQKESSPALGNSTTRSSQNYSSHGRKTSFSKHRVNRNQRHILTNEKDIVEQAVAEDLYAWGVDAEKHPFFHEAIKAVHNIVDEKGVEKPKSRQGSTAHTKQNFPNDEIEAIKLVLKTEIEGQDDVVDDYVDMMESSYANLGFAPYLVKKAHDGSLMRKLKNEYQGVDKDLLDPFNRFIEVQMDKKDYIYSLFFKKNNIQRLLGLVFEAMVASHVIHRPNVQCKSCGESDLFEWKGGRFESWKDLECTNCHSTYEIKSKASMKHINGILTGDRPIHGGSFKGFHTLKKNTRASSHHDAKHYLVLVSRNEVNHEPNSDWGCKVVQIDQVFPTINPKSFASYCPEKRIRFKTRVGVKRGFVYQCWFNIPYKRLNAKGIAHELYSDYYSS